MNRWVVIAGFAALAAVLVLEGAALCMTLQDRAAIASRIDQTQPMMRLLFNRITSKSDGNVASLPRSEPTRL